MPASETDDNSLIPLETLALVGRAEGDSVVAEVTDSGPSRA